MIDKDIFIENLYKTYIQKFYIYNHVHNKYDIEFLAFTHGILYILLALNIDPSKITIKNSTLKEEIDLILENYKSSDLTLSEEEKLHAFVHDKDDVNIRKYIPSGE